MNYNGQESAPHGQQHAPPVQAPSAHAVLPSHFEVAERKLRTYDRLQGGEPAAVVRPAGTGDLKGAVARVQVAQGAPRQGKKARPAFAVNSVYDGSPLCTVQPAGEGEYEVYGGDGAALGRIARRGGAVLPWPRRVRWTVQLASSGESLGGKVGTWYAWLGIVVFVPFYALLWLIMTAYALLHLLIGEKEDTSWDLGSPSRTLWRGAGSGTVIEHEGNCVYRIGSPQVDHRLAYALAVLHAWDR